MTKSTRNKTKKALPLVAPLRRVVGLTGEAVRVKIPFSTCDLKSWQEKVRSYIENRSKAAKRFEFIVKNREPAISC